jgi:hypothetical protein
MKYAVFKNNQFVKLTNEISPANLEYMYYEIDLSEFINELENKIEQKYSHISILQKIKFLFTGKL